MTRIEEERTDEMVASVGKPTTLADCPVGLFLAENGELCLKTEYGNNEGRIDAYIVSTGEFFWGSAPQTIASQRQQPVRPVMILPPELKELRAQGGVRVWDIEEFKVWRGIDPSKPQWASRGFACSSWGAAKELTDYLEHNDASLILRVVSHDRLSALETEAVEPVAWLGVACSDPHSVPIKQVQAEMREAALQIAADANGGYIGRKVVQIVNAAISSIFAENRADPKTGAPIKMPGDAQ